MIVTIVYVLVKETNISDFIKASKLNQAASVKEEGNLRFDLIQNANDPNRFVLYEAYETKEAAGAHKETEHYLKWKDTVADWMASPRNGVPYDIISL